MSFKCPFCKSDLDRGEIQCSHCKKVFNSYNNQPIYKQQIKKNLPILSYEDFQAVAKACVNTVQDMKKERNQAIIKLAHELTCELFHPNLDALFSNELIKADEKEMLSDSLEALIHLWLLVCFMLGVENNFRRISSEEFSVYLPAISFPVGFHLIQFVLLLKSKNILSTEEAEAFEQKIKNQITKVSTDISSEGQKHPFDVQSKILVGELTAFSLELKQIRTV